MSITKPYLQKRFEELCKNTRNYADKNWNLEKDQDKLEYSHAGYWVLPKY